MGSSVYGSPPSSEVDPDEGVNEDVLAGTLMTIQDFITVSFGKMGESGLKEIKFGDREILIERGNNIITAVVASGDVPKDFNKYVQEVIGQIEERYQSSLSDWDGNLSNLVGVQQMLTNLFKEKGEDGEPDTGRSEPQQADEPEPQQTDEPEPQQADEPDPQQADEPEPQQTDEPDPQQADEPDPQQDSEAYEDTSNPEDSGSQEPGPEPNNDPQPWPVDDQ